MLTSELLPPFPRTRCTENGSLGQPGVSVPMTVEMSPSPSLRLREPELLVQGRGYRAWVWAVTAQPAAGVGEGGMGSPVLISGVSERC